MLVVPTEELAMAPPPVPSVPSRARTVVLGAAAAGLVLAFVLGPRTLLGAPTTVPDRLARGLAELWQRGSGPLPADLERLVTYWFRWHALKVAICVALVVVSTLLARALWQRYVAGGRGALGGSVATALGLVAALVLALNVQSTAAPLAALLPLLPSGTGDPRVDEALGGLRDSLGASGRAPGHEAARSLVVDAVQGYSVVLAVVSLVAAGVLAVLIVRHVRAGRRAPRGGRARVLHVTVGWLTAIAVLCFAGLAVVGLVGAIDPASTAADLLAG